MGSFKFAEISYEKNINKSHYFWQGKEAKSKLEVCKESLDYLRYVRDVVGVDNIVEEVKNRQSYISDYVAYKFNRTGENVYFIMPMLARDLMDKEDKPFELSDWNLPFEVCFFRIPDGLIHVEDIDVEGIYVEQIYSKKKRTGIRCVAVDNDGQSVIVYEANFDSCDSIYFGFNIDPQDETHDKTNDCGDIIIERTLKLVNNVLEYIHGILNKDEEIEEEEDDEEKDEAEDKEKKEKKKKEDKDKQREKVGVKVVVLCETTKKKKAGKRTGERGAVTATVCHPVEGYWKTYNADCFKGMKGKRVWVGGYERGMASQKRISKVFQVGRQ